MMAHRLWLFRSGRSPRLGIFPEPSRPMPHYRSQVITVGGNERYFAVLQYSSAVITVITRVVTAGSAGSGEWNSMARS